MNTTYGYTSHPNTLRDIPSLLTVRASEPCGSRNYRGKNRGLPLRSARRGIRFYLADIINGVATLPISNARYATLRSGWQRLPDEA